MSLRGLSCNPSKVPRPIIPVRGSSSLGLQVSACSYNGSFGQRVKLLFCLHRHNWTDSTFRYRVPRIYKIKNAMDSSFGDMADDSPAIFPRVNVRDPYKRLGISREASEEEIQAARNFLIKKYAGHKPSVDAIESAHDNIITRSFYERRNPKPDIKKKWKEVSQSRVIKAITSRFEAPSTNFIIKAASAFVILGILTVLFPTEEGPTLQVAISLIASIYFIHERLKSWIRASLYGFGAFFGSWLVGTFLMVSVIPPLLKGPRSLEVMTSLITYAFLWTSSTYLK